jgi:hypothetical protein
VKAGYDTCEAKMRNPYGTLENMKGKNYQGMGGRMEGSGGMCLTRAEFEGVDSIHLIQDTV